MTLSGPSFCWKKIDFQKIRYKSVQNFCVRTIQIWNCFLVCFVCFTFSHCQSFGCPFTLLFLRHFILATFLRSIFFLVAVKRWVVIMVQAWKWDLVRILDHFVTTFAPKLKTFFNLSRQNAVISKIDCCADRSILPLPSAYQEYLVRDWVE